MPTKHGALLLLLGCAGLFWAGGCGSSPSTGSDAGAPVADGGLAADGGASSDGGASLDGGAARDGGGATDGGVGSDGGALPTPTRYPADRLHSPMTPAVATRLRTIVARSAAPDDRVFMKVGASGTVITHLLHCFAGTADPPYEIDLNGRTHLQAAIDYFRQGDAAGTTPFDRRPLSALSGRSAVWAISGDPSPLEQEIAAINPRLALINYGTNDMQLGTTYRSALWGFYDNMSKLLDQVQERGIVPIVTGLNPRTDSAAAARWVPTYDAVTRGMAEARQIPYFDLYLASKDLPAQGLLSDGVHGNYFRSASGSAEPCVFRPEGLQFNYNVRNLETLEVLDRVRRVVLSGKPAPDAEPPALEGDGSPERPFVIDRLPFTHAADTSASTHRDVDAYPACDNGQNESGPEYQYRLVLSERTPVRIIVLDRGDVDVDVHLLGPAATAASCIERDDRIIERTLDAGTYHLVLDTFVPSSGTPLPGPYLLVVVRCEPGDTDCS